MGVWTRGRLRMYKLTFVAWDGLEPPSPGSVLNSQSRPNLVFRMEFPCPYTVRPQSKAHKNEPQSKAHKNEYLAVNCCVLE